MALYRNPMVVAEPYEDSQGPESPTQTSPEELKAFYEDMERVEILERKLSKRKSNSGTSIWSRKSVKRSTTAPPAHPNPPGLSRVPSDSVMAESDSRGESAQSYEYLERGDAPRLAPSRSVVADSRENRNWAENGPWAAVPLPALKVKYPLHNPLGPRWYKNHHLIPPSQKRPSMRPPTFFSPSFPPMHTSSSPEHADDSAGSSRTASHSPLPTPTSSQTRVGEGGKPRSRKTSQTAPDNVDLLDVTDPWGTNWHHQSPYDIGQTTTVAADVHDVSSRPRRASMTTTQSRHKSVTPSPLSQSTSAVHLQAAQPEIQMPRKLSKRRTQTVASTSDHHHQPSENDRRAASAPATPVDHVLLASSREILPLDSTSLPKRMSVAPAPVFSSMQPTPKKEKRGSMLDRLVKKFSLLKKSATEQGPASDWWHHVDTRDTKGYEEPRVDGGRSSSNKAHRDSVKRVPPPSVELMEQVAPVASTPVEAFAENADKASLASVETPYSMGRLTVANPDLPEAEPSGTETPIVDAAPLPPEKPKETTATSSRMHELPVVQYSSQPPADMHQGMPDRALRLDKPLPPPQLATPELSQLRLSDVQAAQAVEEALKPPSPIVPPREMAQKPEQQSQPPVESEEVSSPPQKSHTQNEQHRSRDNSDPVHHYAQATSSSSQSHQESEKPKRTISVVKLTTLSPEHSSSPAPLESVPTQSTPAHLPAQKESPQTVVSQSRSSESKKSHSPSTIRNYDLDNALNGQALTTAYHSHEVRDVLAEASNSKHQSSKPNRSHFRIESVPVQIPFPSTQHTSTPSGSKEQPVTREYEGSPLSVSSILANPPTPYDHRLSIAMSDAPTLPPKNIDEGKHLPKHSPVNPSPSRQTETFKLVRSLSGHVYASSETIMAAGQQWEVVESVEVKGRKEKSSSRRKEQAHKSRDQNRRSKDPNHSIRDSQPKFDDQEPKYKDDRRSRDYEHRSRDHERGTRGGYGPREHERASKDYDQRPKEEQKARDHEHAVREHEQRYERRSREEQRAERRYKDDYRSRDYERASKDYGRGHKDEQKTRDGERVFKRHEQRSREEPRDLDPESRSKDYEPKSRDEQEYNHHEKRSREQDPQPKEYDRRPHDYEHKARGDEYGSRNDNLAYRGEAKRDSKLKPDVESDYHRSSHRSSKQPIQYQDEYLKSRPSGELGFHHEERPRREAKSSRNRDDYRERRSERHHSTLDSHSLSNHAGSINDTHPQAVNGSVSIVKPPTLRLERNPSITARPTSELPSAAEMNAVRAKESWEIERLWKARSMYGLEPNEIANNVIPDSSSSSSKSDDTPNHSAVYGSRHTAYVVQTPFQTSGHQIYHSMPTAPPPIIYSSPASIPSIPDSISSYEPYEHVYRSFPNAPSDYRPSPPIPRPLLNNPLPEPPREVPLELNGLKMTRPSNQHPNDSWTKYNGITTAH